MYKYLGLIVFMWASFSHAANHGSASGLIEFITVKETGYLLIQLSENHANPMECERADIIAIENTNLNKDQMLSISLMAFAGGYKASYWVVGCYEYYGTSFPLGSTATVYRE
jgi:hypothetical protein